MRAACALRIISGRIIFIFGIAERLRTLRYPIFTGGVVEARGIYRNQNSNKARGRGTDSFRQTLRVCHLPQ